MEKIANDFFSTTAAPITTPKPKDTTAAFVIEDEKAANWFLGKLANIRAEQARVKAQAEKRIAELETDYSAFSGRFMPQLEAWAKEESTRRRRKTVTLMQGTVSITDYAPKPIITGYEDALQTARLIAPKAVLTVDVPEVPAIPARTETKLDEKALFAAYLAAQEGASDENGQPLTLPGLTMQDGRTVVKVSFGKEA
jgi:hypothetical protein